MAAVGKDRVEWPWPLEAKPLHPSTVLEIPALIARCRWQGRNPKTYLVTPIVERIRGYDYTSLRPREQTATTNAGHFHPLVSRHFSGLDLISQWRCGELFGYPQACYRRCYRVE